MDEISEKLTEWFGSTPFILIHVVWFTSWIVAHFLGFDSEWRILTVVVSLEAIFLALFVLRGQNVQTKRMEEMISEARRFSKKDLEATKRIEEKL